LKSSLQSLKSSSYLAASRVEAVELHDRNPSGTEVTRATRSSRYTHDSVNRLQRELENKQIDLADTQNRLLNHEITIDALKNELKAKDKDNAMLVAKLQDCTRRLDEVMTQAREHDQELKKAQKTNQELSVQLKELGVTGQICHCEDFRKENMDLRSKLYRLLQRYKEVSQRCEKLESGSVDSKGKVSTDELVNLERQFREVEEYQGKLLSENASLKTQLSQTTFARLERLLKMSNRLFKLSHELSQLLIFLKAFQSGESITLTTLLGLQSTPQKHDADADVVQICETEIEHIGQTLDQLRLSFTELVLSSPRSS
jgi:predicted  nucleic acid-binding Zn-ribbon protein